MTKLDSLLAKDVSKGRLKKEDAEAARERITALKGDGTEGERLPEDVDLVVEVRHLSRPRDGTHCSLLLKAIPEIPDLKIGLFKRLASMLPPPAILGSNTSSISLTRLAAAAGSVSPASAERVVGYATSEKSTGIR